MAKKNTITKKRVQKEAVKKRLASFVLRSRKLSDDALKSLVKALKEFRKALLAGEIKTLIAMAVIVMALIALGIYMITGSGGSLSPDTSGDEIENIIQYRDPLTGVAIDAERFEPFVFSVMVENSADSWPLSGLDQAFLVIEAPVEGNIPRFIAFFDSEREVEEIGPVRSARPYYVDWVNWFDALYAHVGGSPEALDKLRGTSVKDLNEFYNGQYFYRSRLRNAPHNVYTNYELLTSARQSKGWTSYEYENPFSFSEDLTDGYESASTIRIDWSNGSLYDISWTYNSDFGWYARKQSGGEVLRSGAVISSQNIIIIETDVSVVDDVGRKRIRTEGVGRALIFRNGKKIEAIWRSGENGISLEDNFGNEIKLSPGKTWIEVIDSISRVEVSE